MIAVKEQKFVVVNAIIDAIASITDNGLKREILNAKDNDGNTALMVVAHKEEKDRFVEAIINAIANITEPELKREILNARTMMVIRL